MVGSFIGKVECGIC